MLLLGWPVVQFTSIRKKNNLCKHMANNSKLNSPKNKQFSRPWELLAFHRSLLWLDHINQLSWRRKNEWDRYIPKHRRTTYKHIIILIFAIPLAENIQTYSLGAAQQRNMACKENNDISIQGETANNTKQFSNSCAVLLNLPVKSKLIQFKSAYFIM